MIRTNIFLEDKTKLAELKDEFCRVQSMPVISFGNGKFLSQDAAATLRDNIHRLALVAGLPDTETRYGMDLGTGEFLKVGRDVTMTEEEKQ